jgi:hypothetical protein
MASLVSVLVITATVELVLIGGLLEDNIDSGAYNLASGMGALQNIGGIVFATQFMLSIFLAYEGMEETQRTAAIGDARPNLSRLCSATVAIEEQLSR